MISRILFIARDSTIPAVFGAGGVATSGLALGLAENGYQVQAITKKFPGQTKSRETIKPNLEVRRFPRYPRFVSGWFWAHEISRTAISFRPQLIVMRVAEKNFISDLAPITRALKSLSIPAAIKVNFVPARWAKGIEGLLSLARVIICETRGHKDYLAPALKEKAIITPNGFDSDVFSYENTPRQEGNNHYLVMLGTIDKYRNSLKVIEAFGKSKIKYKLKLRVIGSGPDEQSARNLVERLKISDRVEFLNKIKHNNIPKLLKDCYAGIVLPHASSMAYTNPLKLFEFLSMGVPVITSPALEIVHNFDTRCLRFVKDNTVEALVDLFDHLNFSNDIAQSCRETVKVYSWKNIARSLMVKINNEIQRTK